MVDRDSIDYTLSASRIKKHADCPEKYRQRYILGNEPTKAKKGYGEAGGWFHQTVENVLGEHDGEFSKHALTSQFKQEFFRLGDTDVIDTDVIEEDLKETMIDGLQTAARYLTKEEPDIHGLEVPVNFTIDNPTIDRTAYGKIDVVTEDGEIWDWKTGRVHPDSTPRDELIQGCVYMAGYRNEYGELPKAIKFVYVHPNARDRTDSDDDGPCERQVDPTEDSWQEMLSYARSLVEDEESDAFEPDPEPTKCYFCDWEMYCPASEVGIGGVNELLRDEPEAWEMV